MHHLEIARSILLSCMACLTLLVQAAGGEDRPVNFIDDIKPILRQHCLKCHGDDKQEAGINLQGYESLLKGGSGGVVVTAGRSSQSVLFQAITQDDADLRMPPNSPPLPKEKLALIQKWIDSGLRQAADSQSKVMARDLTFTPAANAGSKPDGPPPMPGDLPKVDVPPTRRPLPVFAIDASPWAPLIAVAGWEHVRLIHAETEQEVGQLAFPEGEPHVLRFSRDGAVLMVAGGRPVQSGRVVLFDVRTGKRLAEIGDEVDAVLAADISPDQRLVALGGSGRVVKVYSTTDGTLQYKLTKHTDWISSVAFSPDGSLLASGDRAGGIHLWDTKSGGIVLNLSEHDGAVRGLDWRGDSKLLGSAGEDGRVVWWDITDGFPAINKANAHPPRRPPGTYGVVPNGVLAVKFDRNGNLVTSGRDGVVRVWGPDGNETKYFRVESGIPITIATPSDDVIVSGDSSGVVQFWKKKKKQ
ncbi:MAG: c-type cytochrome domain-containing protein [Planctomycetaceae bacterium]